MSHGIGRVQRRVLAVMRGGHYFDATALAAAAFFWCWHNLHSRHQRNNLVAFGHRNGVELSEDEIDATLRYVHSRHRKFSATTLGKLLRVTVVERELLGLTTIEAHGIAPAVRKELRKRKARLRDEGRRRARGVQPRAEYEAKSVAAQARAEGVSRMTVYRRKRAAETQNAPPHVTCARAAPFYRYGDDAPVTPARAGTVPAQQAHLVHSAVQRQEAFRGGTWRTDTVLPSRARRPSRERLAPGVDEHDRPSPSMPRRGHALLRTNLRCDAIEVDEGVRVLFPVVSADADGACTYSVNVLPCSGPRVTAHITRAAA